MTTLASKIDALEKSIEKLENKRNKLKKERKDLKSQRDGVTDQAKQTALDNRIIAISYEIIAKRNTLNLLLEAQLQGKFPLSFSFFPR